MKVSLWGHNIDVANSSPPTIMLGKRSSSLDENLSTFPCGIGGDIILPNTQPILSFLIGKYEILRRIKLTRLDKLSTWQIVASCWEVGGWVEGNCQGYMVCNTKKYNEHVSFLGGH